MLAASSHKTILWVSLAVLIVVLVTSIGVLLVLEGPKKPAATLATKTATSSSSAAALDASANSKAEDTFVAHPPDHTKLPLGDEKYTSSPKVGYIDVCNSSFNGGGAYKAGPWINQASGSWDLTKKVFVSGKVSWPASKVSTTLSGTSRVITSNGLPSHTTGTFPIAFSDAAYLYDHNPNSIKEQSLSFTLPANPTLLSAPQCIGGEVGIMLSGIPLFDGFDAGGRDAVAWEVQDSCGGHPQESGEYHYHGVSSCLVYSSDPSQDTNLVGYAYDGFGIFGPTENGVEVSSSDLDECHGHTSLIKWDGKMVKMYHYNLTYDFPYSLGCFRGKSAVSGPTSGGQSSSGQSTKQQGGQGQAGQNGQQKLPPPSGQPPY